MACVMCLRWQEKQVSVPACNKNAPLKIEGRWRLPVGNDGFVTLPALS